MYPQLAALSPSEEGYNATRDTDFYSFTDLDQSPRLNIILAYGDMGNFPGSYSKHERVLQDTITLVKEDERPGLGLASNAPNGPLDNCMDPDAAALSGGGGGDADVPCTSIADCPITGSWDCPLGDPGV